MTDIDAGAVAAEGEAAELPGIRILAQFARDFSFENPRAPEALRAISATNTAALRSAAIFSWALLQPTSPFP